MASVQLDKTLCQSKPDAKAPCLIEAVVSLHEKIEYPLKHFGSDAGPVIAHPQDNVGLFERYFSSMRPLGGVYFNALPRRFARICSRRV